MILQMMPKCCFVIAVKMVLYHFKTDGNELIYCKIKKLEEWIATVCHSCTATFNLLSDADKMRCSFAMQLTLINHYSYNQ